MSSLRKLLLTAVAMLLSVVAAVAQTADSVAPPRPHTPLEKFLADPSVNSATTSVYIAELGSGRVLARHNADLPLMGASTMKIVTIGAMMRCRDINYRFTTLVETAGRVNDGVLEGNLHVTGSGDPSLNSDRPPQSPDIVTEIVRALQARRIKGIAGHILVDQSIFVGPSQPESWSGGDRANDYGAGAFGLNFGRNRSGSRSVSNPAAVFLSRLEKALADGGIALEKREFRGGGRRVLLKHRSAPLDEIMRSCMMRSDNLYAECLLRHVSVACGKEGSVASGAAEVTDIWRRTRAPMQGVRILDGSGLSRSDRLTAHFLAHVLRHCGTDPYYASFFPLAGAEGTLRSFLKGTRLETYVALKTGSLHDVQAYAGYRLDDEYAPTHVVVVIANGFRGGRQSLRRAVSNLLLSYL